MLKRVVYDEVWHLTPFAGVQDAGAWMRARLGGDSPGGGHDLAVPAQPVGVLARAA